MMLYIFWKYFGKVWNFQNWENWVEKLEWGKIGNLKTKNLEPLKYYYSPITHIFFKKSFPIDKWHYCLRRLF